MSAITEIARSSASYYVAIALLIICLPLIVWGVLHFNLFFGKSLNAWIAKTCEKSDAASAQKLAQCRMLLSCLAHDVLKHRLLGLISLVQSRAEEDDNFSVHSGDYDDFVEELFRLCGAKATPDERLWARWKSTFQQIRMISDRKTLHPYFDPVLNRTQVMLLRLRSLFNLYVAREKISAITPASLKKLQIEKCRGIHAEILKLTDAAHPILRPCEVVKSALENLSMLRPDFALSSTVRTECDINGVFQSDLPPASLCMALERLLDNALNYARQVQLTVKKSEDDLTGAETIVFSVFDDDEHIPSVSEYGRGIKGIVSAFADFDASFAYKRVSEPGVFKKEARIVIPVLPYAKPETPKKRMRASIATVLFLFVLILLSAVSTLRLIGGTPIQFAGGGENVVEFRINVGEKFEMPLCSGGNNPTVSVKPTQMSCWEGQCSLPAALDKLMPCEEDLSSADCPGKLVWTPEFHDGSRLGKNYELLIDCSSHGMPKSRDSRKIRIVVARPNSPPEVRLLQLFDVGRQMPVPLSADGNTKVSADATLKLQAFAVDKDDDLILYSLHTPDGKSLVSYDGTFQLRLDWSAFGTWTGKLQVSDQGKGDSFYEIRLQADKLRPIALLNAGIWNNLTLASQPCTGSGNARLCTVEEGQINEFVIELWFDPILPQVRDTISLSAMENSDVELRELRTNNGFGRWDVYAKNTKQLLAIIELTNAPHENRRGKREYDFRIAVAPGSPFDPQHWGIRLVVEEESKRVEKLEAYFSFLKRRSKSAPSLVLSRNKIQFKECEARKASFKIFSAKSNQSVLTSKTFKIFCENEKLVEHFEPPSVTEAANGTLNVEIAFKGECVHGLNALTPENMRTCFIEVPDNQNGEKNLVWITVEDVSSPPVIDAVNVSENKEQGYAAWTARIRDIDNDLEAENIGLDSRSPASLRILSSDVVNRVREYRVEVLRHFSCKSAPSSLNLTATDREGHQSAYTLNHPSVCESLIRTESGKKDFVVDDNETIDIALLADNNVKIEKAEGIGTVKGSHFIWTANCLYGRGPHRIVLKGTADNRYGENLVLNIAIGRCEPRLIVEKDGVGIDTLKEIAIEIGKSAEFTLSTYKADMSDLILEAGSDNPDLGLLTTFKRNDSGIVIRCPQKAIRATVILNVVPKEENSRLYLPSRSVFLYIACFDPVLESSV